jgi:hypothetical protein
MARRSLKVPVVIALVTSLAAGTAATVNAGTAGAASAAKPILFGAAGSSRSMIEQNESIMGSKVVGARVYRSWGQPVFTNDLNWARDTGHVLFVSIKTVQSGKKLQWSAIAAAQPGSALYSQMVTQAQQVKTYKARVYLSLNHEPEADSSRTMGTAAQYVAAWRKWVTVLKAQGATNARFVFAATAWGFSRTGDRSAAAYYPGDGYVDAIAADGYNWAGCQGDNKGNGWRELSQVIEAQRQFGLKHPTKALMVWEFGSAEDNNQPGRKAQWLRNARALFKQAAYSQYTAVLSWEGRAYGGGKCKFDYLSSSTAKTAWKEFGPDKAYDGTAGM